MNEAEFNRLIERYQRGTLPEAERELVDQWLQSLVARDQQLDWDEGDVSHQARQLLNRVRQDTGTNRLSYMGPLQSLNRTMEAGKPGPAKVLLRIAAFVLLLVSAGYSFFFLNNALKTPEYAEGSLVELTIAGGQRLSVELPDGSVVLLNASSTIKYPETFSDSLRVVELMGEAFFEVAKDPHKPFVVRTGTLTTRVLGTSFNVRYREGEDRITVALLSGKVRVQAPAGTHVLEKGDLAVLGKEGSTIELRKWDYLKDFGWKDGVLYFDRATLPEIARAIEDWYGVDVVIMSGRYKEGHYTGSFDNESLKNVLESLSFSFEFSYKWEGNRVEIRFN